MVEAFGAIHSAGEQPGDVAVMPGSTMKQRDVLVDREGRRDRRSELNQLHVLLCVVARQHVQLPIRWRRRGSQLTAATAFSARKRSSGSRHRYGLPETSPQLVQPPAFQRCRSALPSSPRRLLLHFGCVLNVT